MPIRNVPGPEIAGLGEYGKIPVSLYTGIPDISIPLYELEVGAYSLPLSAAYHLASVKPHSQPGCLGLGWSLVAGGYITRVVHGLYDEKCHTNGYAPGYYAHASRLKNITTEQFVEDTKHILDMENKYYELSADEFSFNFCGYSGNFYYKGDGEWCVVSDQDIRVEFTPVDGEGFINSAELEKRIDLRGWGARGSNDRFFNKFTLITPDGCRYEFGGLQATEYSVPYYARYNSDLIPTTWRLSKITTVDQRVITFTYDTSSIMLDQRYVPQQKILTGMACTPHTAQIGRNAMTGHLLFPVNIKTIQTPNETLEFNYFNENGYCDRFVDPYLAWSHNVSYQRDDIYSNIEDPANQFSLFLGKGIDTSSEAELRNSIKAKLKSKVLHSIYVKRTGGAALKTIYFDYTYSLRRKLSLITERRGNPALVEGWIQHPHGPYIFTGYNIPELPTEGSVQEYHFTYNSSVTMPVDYVRAKADSWGYYSGGTIEFASFPSFTKKTPIKMYTEAEVLKEIIFPTGGKSRFEYELNGYSQVVNASGTSVDARLGTAGGLRIKQVTRLSREDSILGTKRYFYSDTRKSGGKSSGILRSEPVFEAIYYSNEGKVSLTLKSEGGFFPQVTNLNTPDVGYSCVIEETLDKNQKSQGYILRRFSNYDKDIYGRTHFDEPPLYSDLIGTSYIKPFTSRSMERGKLLAEEYYDENEQLKKKINYKYKEVNPNSFVTAQQEIIFFCSDIYDFRDSRVGTLTKTYTHAYLTDSIIETIYIAPDNKPFTKKQAYNYNKYKLLQDVSASTSDGRNTLTGYKYGVEDVFSGSWMQASHILSPISCKREQTGTDYKEESYQYEKTDKTVPYIRNAGTTVNGHKQTFYTVKSTDVYGNPVEIVEQGIPVVLIWAGEGQRMIARIENVAREVLKDKLGTSPESFSTMQLSKVDYKKIEDIRHKVPQAHFYIYKYTPGMRLQSATTPNGKTTFYRYDYLGKLRETYFIKDNLVRCTENRYDYHYYNSDKESIGNEVEDTLKH